MRTLTILLAALLTACSTTPTLDREFGNSVRQARAQQTLNPDAGRTPRPVNGLDAPAARRPTRTTSNRSSPGTTRATASPSASAANVKERLT
jgi:hypothetical protein